MMKVSKVLDYIDIDAYSATPKYLQVSNSIVQAVELGKIKKDTLLPSINDLSFQLDISRDTAEKAYRKLKELGIVGSFPGKGYFIINAKIKQSLKIFLLFNKLSAHKKIVYDSFVKSIGEQAIVDLYIYNNDFSTFKTLLNRKRDEYSHYVIIPHFLEGGENAPQIINEIPKEKLVILDKLIPNIKGDYAAVYQNFEKDIYTALEQARKELRKYHTLKIIFPKRSYFPIEILKGFSLFCHEYAFNMKTVYNIAEEPMQAGEVYINLMEDDLVTLIEKINDLKLKIGTDVGVISYNETPLKKLILNGITTISTDFVQMGSTAAQLILDNSTNHVEVPFHIKKRPSL
jgi:DNA-binding transcriptional regulator YhcF (GntR family)